MKILVTTERQILEISCKRIQYSNSQDRLTLTGVESVSKQFFNDDMEIGEDFCIIKGVTLFQVQE